MTAMATDTATTEPATAGLAGQPMTALPRSAPMDALAMVLVSTTRASATDCGHLLIARHKAARTTALVTDIAVMVPACVVVGSLGSTALFHHARMSALDTELARMEGANARTRGQILIAL